jgi:hypothetical protein
VKTKNLQNQNSHSAVEARVIKKNADGLLPCPFCARTNMDIVEWNKNLFSISCKCGAESPNDSKSKEGIKRIWNRRRLESIFSL